MRWLFLVLAWSAALPAVADCATSREFEQLMLLLREHTDATATYNRQSACLADTDRLARAIRGKSRGDALMLALRSGTDARRRGDDAAACTLFVQARKAAEDDLADLRTQALRCGRH